jgi:hypothetical protein
MIGARAKVTENMRAVAKQAKDGTFESLSHAAGYIRKVAKSSIRPGRKPSQSGQPPHTQTRRLPRAIVYAVDRRVGEAVIGPSAELVGPAGKPHEHGGRFRGTFYPERPFMLPALMKSKPRLPTFWANSVR